MLPDDAGGSEPPNLLEVQRRMLRVRFKQGESRIRCLARAFGQRFGVGPEAEASTVGHLFQGNLRDLPLLCSASACSASQPRLP